MGFLMVVAFMAAILSLIYGSFVAALISTPLIYVFEKLSKFLMAKKHIGFFLWFKENSMRHTLNSKEITPVRN